MSKARQSTRQRYRGTRLDMRKGGRVGFVGADADADDIAVDEKDVGWFPGKYLLQGANRLLGGKAGNRNIMGDLIDTAADSLSNVAN